MWLYGAVVVGRDLYSRLHVILASFGSLKCLTWPNPSLRFPHKITLRNGVRISYASYHFQMSFLSLLHECSVCVQPKKRRAILAWYKNMAAGVCNRCHLRLLWICNCSIDKTDGAKRGQAFITTGWSD